MNKKIKKILDIISSVKLVVGLFVVISLISIIGTVIPQHLQKQEYIHNYGQNLYNVIKMFSLNDIYGSVLFIALIILLTLSLAVCSIKRFSLKIKRIGSTITHIGMVVIFAGALIGLLFGQKGYVKIYEKHMVDTFYLRGSNKPVKLDFKIYLEDFILEKYNEDKYMLCVKLPGYEKTEELDVELENEYILGDKEYKITILRYVSDFVMDTKTGEITSRSNAALNPAVQVEIVNLKNGHSDKKWLFAKYPDMHNKSDNCGIDIKYHFVQGEIKDFKSKLIVKKGEKNVLKQTIEVNHPLVYNGYVFYQSSYDSKRLKWTGLSVVRDPGVGIVYAGFILVIIGIMCIVYIRK